MKNDYQTLIKEICEELNIKVDFLSKNWLIRLEKNNIIKIITGYKFPLNDHAIGIILDDKYATYESVKSINIPVCEHHIIYDKKNSKEYAKNCNSFKYVYDYFLENNKNIVIKANDGRSGKGVYHVTSKRKIKKVLKILFKKHYSLSMMKCEDIENEYRIIMLNNNPELIYKKVKSEIIGNGKKTIKKLLYEFNPIYFSDINNKKYNKILKNKEKYTYNWKFNLSTGANVSMDINESDKNIILKMAIEICQKLNINFASVDIVKLKDGEYKLLEINSGVTLNHFAIICKNGKKIQKDIYTKAIKSLMNL